MGGMLNLVFSGFVSGFVGVAYASGLGEVPAREAESVVSRIVDLLDLNYTQFFDANETYYSLMLRASSVHRPPGWKNYNDATLYMFKVALSDLANNPEDAFVASAVRRRIERVLDLHPMRSCVIGYHP